VTNKSRIARGVTALIVGLVLLAASSSHVRAADDAVPRGLADHFVVTADDCAIDLGAWSKAGAATRTLTLSDQRAERIGGARVVLVRAAGSDTLLVRRWLETLGTAHTPTTVTITRYDETGHPVATWSLRDAFPEKWSVSGSDAGGSKIAIETLELTHVGLRPTAPCSTRTSSSP
jgi:phage tail-like protein